MKINEVRKIPKRRGINTYHMRKIDMIRSIQRAEGNIDCYGTDRATYCGEEGCLWRQDCLELIRTA